MGMSVNRSTASSQVGSQDFFQGEVMGAQPNLKKNDRDIHYLIVIHQKVHFLLCMEKYPLEVGTSVGIHDYRIGKIQLSFILELSKVFTLLFTVKKIT